VSYLDFEFFVFFVLNFGYVLACLKKSIFYKKKIVIKEEDVSTGNVYDDFRSYESKVN